MADLSTEAVGLAAAAPRARRRRIVVLISLSLVLVAVVAALFMVRTIDSQLADLGRTYEIRREARELMLSIVDAETGQRGYLLTADPAYLDPYNRAVSNLSDTYQSLMKLIEGNAPQRLRIEALLPDLDAKRAEMAQTIELMSAGRNADALALLRTDTGQELMDRIRSNLRAFNAEEDARLIERNSRMEIYRQAQIIAILAALASAAVLGYSLLARTQRRVVALAQEQSLLRSQNEELEARVRERTAEAEEARAHAERERARLETLLQDTNHRIGNSLATVSSLLGLQLARTGSDEVKRALEAAQSRVQAIASGHRRLRLGADLETTDAAEFLGEVIEDLAASVPPDKTVDIVREVEALVIPARDATTIGIVVSELVTNAVKHAFPDKAGGTVWVRFRRDGHGILLLEVEDDGAGLSQTEGPQAGLGALIINQLAKQFGGTEPAYSPRDGGGTRVVVELPKLSAEGAA